MSGWRKTGWTAALLTTFLCAAVPSFGQVLPDLSYKYESEEEARKWREGEYEMPPFPEKSNLREFSIDAPSTNRFMVDESTLSVGKDGVVRYVLVVAASGGAETATFEGIRCHSGEYRIYAMGMPDHTWKPSRNSDWRRIGAARPRADLLEEYFCDGPAPPVSRSALLRQLESYDRGRPGG